MATDATGTPTSLGIPKYNTAVDAPTGRGFNAAMDVINDLFEASTVSMPTGTMLPFAGEDAPDGWLLCDGTAVSTTTYGALFAVISTFYGSGGAGTFRVPDARGRTLIGAGTGAGLTGRDLATTGGQEGVVLSNTQLPPHQHSTFDNGVVGGFGQALLQPPIGGGPITVWAVPSGQSATPMNTGLLGSGLAHENMPPFLTVNYIIKT